MIGSSVRRVGAAVAVAGTALLAFAAPLPSASAGRPWLSTLDRCALAGLAIGAVLQAAVPRLSLVWLAGVTALAVGGLATASRPGRLEAASTIAVVLAPPLLLLLSVKLSIPAGRAPPFVLAIAGIATLAAVRTMVYEPFADINCPGLCRHNPILISKNLDLAHSLGLVMAAATMVVAAATGLPAIRALWPIRRDDSYRVSAQLCTATAVLVLGVDSAARLTSNNVAVPSDTSVRVLAVASAAAVLLSGALIVAALHPIRARRDVDKVARLLTRSDIASDIQTIFREGFGDPNLWVGYWVDGVGYLDECGELLSTATFRSRIELTSRGQPLAVVAHGRDALSSELLVQQLGSRARLAIHNASLTLELNRSVAEVARSRRRIVEVGDAERRRLERDLHDGAQQRLLALSFELRRGERSALAAGDTRSAAGFGSANELAQIALEQLRRLAHGIHPAMLEGAGLHDALLEFAASHGRAISVAIDVTDPIPLSVESAVYGVLTAAIANTAISTETAIFVRRVGEEFSLAIDNVSDLPQHAVDRAEAVGGRCARTDHGFEMVLPCAW